MTGADGPDQPLSSAARSAAAETVAAFELLANETRLAILLALWEAYDPTTAEGVGFAALRKRVGVRDSGQFNYHLGRLEGRFVDATELGYRLRPAGLALVQTVVADTASAASLPPTAIDVPCHRCGANTVLSYEDGWLFHCCTACPGTLSGRADVPDGGLFAEPFPAAALADRTPEELFTAGVFRLLEAMRTKVGGLCPRCAGPITTTIDDCPAHDCSDDGVCGTCGRATGTRIRWLCPVCKYHGGTTPAVAAMALAPVVAFYHDHGVDVGPPVTGFDQARELLSLLRAHEQTVSSRAPFRVDVTVTVDGETLGLTLDDGLAVREHRRS